MTPVAPTKIGVRKVDSSKNLGAGSSSGQASREFGLVSSPAVQSSRCLKYIEAARTCIGSNDYVKARNNILLAKRYNSGQSCDAQLNELCTEFNTAGQQALAAADALKDAGDRDGAIKAYQQAAATFDIVPVGSDAITRLKAMQQQPASAPKP